MDYLLYSSKEMFSSTDLIRKSKMIFDKVSSNEINKAIILRDGKPAFIMLDFDKYEELMKDYQLLKGIKSSNNTQEHIKEDKAIAQKGKEQVLKSEQEIEKIEIIDEEAELLKTLKALDEMEFEEVEERELKNLDDFNEDDVDDYDDEIYDDDIAEETQNKSKVQPLKDFWE